MISSSRHLTIRFLLAFFASYIFTQCSNEEHSGNTMETENSVAFQVQWPDGSPAANVPYSVRPTHYLAVSHVAADTSWYHEGISDSAGWIRITSIPGGEFVVMLAKDYLAVSLHLYSSDSVISLPPTAKLAAAAAITGSVALDSSDSSAEVRLYGYDFQTITDSNGYFELPGLPATSVRLVAWGSQTRQLLADTTITLGVGATRNLGLLHIPADVVDSNQWAQSTHMPGDSLVSDWMLPLQFPSVVTLRLDSLNFNFTTAANTGHDLRLYNNSGKSLRIAKVVYDSSARQAIIRVRLDSPFDTAGTWTMRWGCNLCTDADDPTLWSGISDSLMRAMYSLTVGTFENTSNLSDLPKPIPASYWFTSRSAGSTFLGGIDTNLAAAWESAGDGRSGKAAHVAYTTSAVGDWVLLGSMLGTKAHSLASIDSAEFWIRGNGRFAFALENNTDGLPLGRKAWIYQDAPSTWTRVAIRPSDFLPGDDNGGNVGWQAIQHSITNLSLFGTSGTEFWIDDVRLYGINRDDLL